MSHTWPYFICCICLIELHYRMRKEGAQKKSLADQMNMMDQWLQQWGQASQDVMHFGVPYDGYSYQMYLQWYTPRTRTRLLRVDDQPPRLSASTAALYPGHAGVALHHVVRDLCNFASFFYPRLYLC